MLPTAAGALLTGSSDGCIRCWDASQVDHSYMVCGPPTPLDRSFGEEKLMRYKPHLLIKLSTFFRVSICVARRVLPAFMPKVAKL